MYIAFLGVLMAFALGFGVWATQPAFTSADFAEARARTIAQVILQQHTRAVAWVEEEDFDGVRVNARDSGPIEPSGTIGGIAYDLDAFAEIQTIRIAGASNADWATITFITPTVQHELRDNSPYPLEPDSVLRNLVEKSGDARYTIGVYQGGALQPLDRSAELAAPSDTKWSPMDDRDPATIPGTAGVDKPTARVEWIRRPLPGLLNAPAGLVDGSWVILTMTPSS